MGDAFGDPILGGNTSSYVFPDPTQPNYDWTDGFENGFVDTLYMCDDDEIDELDPSQPSPTKAQSHDGVADADDPSPSKIPLPPREVSRSPQYSPALTDDSIGFPVHKPLRHPAWTPLSTPRSPLKAQKRLSNVGDSLSLDYNSEEESLHWAQSESRDHLGWEQIGGGTTRLGGGRSGGPSRGGKAAEASSRPPRGSSVPPPVSPYQLRHTLTPSKKGGTSAATVNAIQRQSELPKEPLQELPKGRFRPRQSMLARTPPPPPTFGQDLAVHAPPQLPMKPLRAHPSSRHDAPPLHPPPPPPPPPPPLPPHHNALPPPPQQGTLPVPPRLHHDTSQPTESVHQKHTVKPPPPSRNGDHTRPREKPSGPLHRDAHREPAPPLLREESGPPLRRRKDEGPSAHHPHEERPQPPLRHHQDGNSKLPHPAPLPPRQTALAPPDTLTQMGFRTVPLPPPPPDHAPRPLTIRPSDTVGADAVNEEPPSPMSSVQEQDSEDDPEAQPPASEDDEDPATIFTKFTGRPSAAFSEATNARFEELRDIISQTASESGYSEDLILDRFVAFMSLGTRTRASNPFNIYQKYANDPRNRRTEYMCINTDISENPGVMTAHQLGLAWSHFQDKYPDGAAVNIMKAYEEATAVDEASAESLGHRRNSFDGNMTQVRRMLCAINRKAGFEAMLMMVGQHVNEDGLLGDYYVTPGLEKFFDVIDWDANDLIGLCKTGAYNNVAETAVTTRRGTTSRIRSTTRTLSREPSPPPTAKEPGDPVVIKIKNMLSQISQDDLKFNVFRRGGNNFAWTVLHKMLARFNVTVTSFPTGGDVRLPNEARTGKAISAITVTDTDALLHAMSQREGRDGYGGIQFFRRKYRPGHPVIYTHNYAEKGEPKDPENARTWWLKPKKPVLSVDAEGRTSEVLMDMLVIEGYETEVIDVDEIVAPKKPSAPKKRKRTLVSVPRKSKIAPLFEEDSEPESKPPKRAKKGKPRKGRGSDSEEAQFSPSQSEFEEEEPTLPPLTRTRSARALSRRPVAVAQEQTGGGLRITRTAPHQPSAEQQHKTGSRDPERERNSSRRPVAVAQEHVGGGLHITCIAPHQPSAEQRKTRSRDRSTDSPGPERERKRRRPSLVEVVMPHLADLPPARTGPPSHSASTQHRSPTKAQGKWPEYGPLKNDLSAKSSSSHGSVVSGRRWPPPGPFASGSGSRQPKPMPVASGSGSRAPEPTPVASGSGSRHSGNEPGAVASTPVASTSAADPAVSIPGNMSIEDLGAFLQQLEQVKHMLVGAGLINLSD
ncbi:hypothetical protein DFH09DRAFT_1067196 [Mycena vulgaris]|nr:hypothetical protein DFH09DRAFT_1067196 [Mycena vulgaris]